MLASTPVHAGVRPQGKSLIPVEVHARVVDEKGEAVAGAGFLYGDRETITTALALDKPTGCTDDKGNLSVTIPAPKEGDTTVRYAILAATGKVTVQLTVRMTTVATGKGAARRRVVDLGRIVMRPGVKIRGLVRSMKGKPIAGARVHAVDIFKSLHLQMQIEEQCTSWATTDEKGRFTVHGVPARGASVTITADGFQTHEVQHANQFTPVVAQLSSSGETSGRVVDAAGKPVPEARIWTYYEYSNNATYVRADADGQFRVPVRYPGRYQLSASILHGVVSRTMRTKVLVGPMKDVRIEIPDAVASSAKLGFEIRAKTLDGKPIVAFKALAHWSNDQFWKYNGSYLERMFKRSAKSANAKGVILLSGPRPGQPPTGRVLVRAKGYAPKLLKQIEWSDEKRVKMDLTLEPESVIEGVVIDEKTGKPLSGARVHVGGSLREAPNPFMRLMTQFRAGGGSETDEHGRFRLDTLGKGTHRLTVTYPDRPNSTRKMVKVGSGETKKGIKLTTPRGSTLGGKLVGAKIGVGWKVKCNQNAVSQSIMLPTSQSLLSGGPGSKGVLVGSDGKFRIEGLSKARYQLTLMIPYPMGTLDIPLKSVRVRAKDLNEEIDISKYLPIRFHGKALARGAPITPLRLLVLAQRVDGNASNRGISLTSPMLTGTRALVKRDGTFELPVRSGKHVIRLVDLASGVTLFQSERLISIKGKKDVEFDIVAELAMVMVTLKPDKEGGPVLANRLEIGVKHPNLMPNQFRGMVFGGANNYDQGVGVALQPGQVNVTVILPAIETKLRARSSAHQLDAKKSQHNYPHIGEETVHPEASKANRITVVVVEPDVPTG